MGRSQESFSKQEKEKKKAKKRQEKAAKKEARKAAGKRSLDDMIGYVDEYGNPTDTPPDPSTREEINAEDIVIGVPKKEKAPEPSPFRQGRIEFFNDEKGFGFIKENDTGDKFFVHISGLQDEVVENDKVQFEVEQGLKGPNAVRVKKI